MIKQVDSFCYIDGITKRIIKSWINLEPERDIPWIPLSKPLAERTFALISSGGIALKTDEPFDQDGERQNPWWGDPTYRVIPKTTTADDIKLYHLHVDPSFVEQDINCLLPLQRLAELEAAGEIGRVADSHYSFMGYNLQPEQLLEETTPAIITNLQEEGVDTVILIPA
jgi:D-proline reductase (dithiol) PrdB